MAAEVESRPLCSVPSSQGAMSIIGSAEADLMGMRGIGASLEGEEVVGERWGEMADENNGRTFESELDETVIHDV